MAAVSTARRFSAREKLEGLFFDDDEWAILERTAIEADLEAVGFRHHAKSTQKRQDAHLTLYVNYVKRSRRMPFETPQEQVLPLAFPPDVDLLISQFRQ